MQGHSNGVYSVSFNHDGSILACSSDTTIKLWSMPDRLTVSDGEDQSGRVVCVRACVCLG